MKYITFEEWQKTAKQHTAKVAREMNDAYRSDNDVILYGTDGCFGAIEIVPVIYPESEMFGTLYHVVLSGEESIGELIDMERKLHDFQVDRGYLTVTPTEAERMQEATDYAQDALFCKLAELFPNIKSGDVNPQDMHTLDHALATAAHEWVKENK